MKHDWQVGDIGRINNRSHSGYVGAEFEVTRRDEARREIHFRYLNRPEPNGLQKGLIYSSMDNITDFIGSSSALDECADFFV